MSRHKDLPKCSCIYCSKEIYVIYVDKHIKSCKMVGKIKDIDYVICPICGKRLKEINTAHLVSHNMDVYDFDEQYPFYNRLSSDIRNKKATFTGREHTEDYKRHMSSVMKGVNKGKVLTDDHKEKISMAVKKVWSDKYEHLSYTKTFDYYIEKHGDIEGSRRWYQKNLKNSLSSKVIFDRDGYGLYKELVSFYTNYSLEKYDIKDKNKLNRYWHLDHKYPQSMGFNNGILPIIIGSPYNLQIVSREYNCRKQHYFSDISIDQLYEYVYRDTEYINDVSNLIGYINEIRTARAL